MKILLFLLCLSLTACSNTVPVLKAASSSVTIVKNATIYTMAKQGKTVQAFAHKDGIIIATGHPTSLTETYPNARQVDLEGHTIVPGFIDAHGHLLGLGQSLIYVDLVGSNSKKDILNRLKKAAKGLPEGQWLLGRGWDQNDWPVKELPNAADLDVAFPERPVWLERIDGHAGWANSATMAYAQTNLTGTWQPDGGEIVRNAQGQPNGVFIDNAYNLIQAHAPEPSEAELKQALQKAMVKATSVGLTGMHDAGTSLQVWRILEQLNKDGELGIRVYAMADGGREMLDYLCETGAKIDPAARLTARSVKLYSDGALGSRGAALLTDYSDSAHNQGLLVESKQTLTSHATRAIKCGLQVNIHAIGDRGNRITLDVLEASSQTLSGRHRVEHSQVVALDDFQRFKDLKLIASVQPTHATSDMYWAEDRVGKGNVLKAPMRGKNL